MKCKNIKQNVKHIFTNSSSLIFPLQSQYSYVLQSFPLTLSCLLFNSSLTSSSTGPIFHKFSLDQLCCKPRDGGIATFLLSIKLIKVSGQLSQLLSGKLHYILSPFPPNWVCIVSFIIYSKNLHTLDIRLPGVIIPQLPLSFFSCSKYFVLLYSLIPDLTELIKVFITRLMFVLLCLSGFCWVPWVFLSFLAWSFQHLCSHYASCLTASKHS